MLFVLFGFCVLTTWKLRPVTGLYSDGFDGADGVFWRSWMDCSIQADNIRAWSVSLPIVHCSAIEEIHTLLQYNGHNKHKRKHYLNMNIFHLSPIMDTIHIYVCIWPKMEVEETWNTNLKRSSIHVGKNWPSRVLTLNWINKNKKESPS